MIGDTWSTTALTMTLKYLIQDSSNNKERVQQLDFIEAFLQANIKKWVFCEPLTVYMGNPSQNIATILEDH